jgi:hypothetical protein
MTAKQLEAIDLIERLKEKWHLETDKDFARRLKMDNSYVSRMRKHGVSNLFKNMAHEVLAA